jgi:hypothetical protein
VNETGLLPWLDKIGTIGLGFMVWTIMTGRLVIRRELDREIARSDRLEQRLERAMELGDKAVSAGRAIADKLPPKN